MDLTKITFNHVISLIMVFLEREVSTWIINLLTELTPDVHGLDFCGKIKLQNVNGETFL